MSTTTIKPIKLSIEQAELAYRKNYVPGANKFNLIIEEHFVKFHYIVECEERTDPSDEQSPYKEVMYNWRATINRSSMIGPSIHWDMWAKSWAIELAAVGMGHNVPVIMIADGEQAYDLFKKLEDLHIQYTTGKPFVGAVVE